MESDKDQAENLSPQERNQEMMRIFQFLSKEDIARTTEYSKEAWDEVIEKGERRERIESTQILKKRLDGLLKHANITNSAKRYILENYFDYHAKYGFSEGVWEDNAELFRWDMPESGGIFTTPSAREIEEDLYRNALQSRLRLKQEIEIAPQDQLLREWANEFRQFYGDEPPSTTFSS